MLWRHWSVEASFDSKKMSVRVICVSDIPPFVLMLDLLSVGLIVGHQIQCNLRLINGLGLVEQQLSTSNR